MQKMKKIRLIDSGPRIMLRTHKRTNAQTHKEHLITTRNFLLKIAAGQKAASTACCIVSTMCIIGFFAYMCRFLYLEMMTTGPWTCSKFQILFVYNNYDFFVILDIDFIATTLQFHICYFLLN